MFDSLVVTVHFEHCLLSYAANDRLLLIAPVTSADQSIFEPVEKVHAEKKGHKNGIL